MGSCVSVHKDPESVMKLRFSIGSKNEKLLIPSPVKEKPVTVNAGDRTFSDVVAVKSQSSPPRFPDAGSKDEAFFDSQPWLESDCEDDFFSVNGDFTPSRGNTPVHHSFSLGNLRVNKAPAEGTIGSIPEPSPSDKKKRLSDLFKESLHENEYIDEKTAANDKNEAPTKVVVEAPYLSKANSGGSSERTPNGVLRAEDKSLRSPQCCLPKLISTRSFSERKKRMSPARNVG